jgi:hypothetical protein
MSNHNRPIRQRQMRLSNSPGPIQRNRLIPNPLLYNLATRQRTHTNPLLKLEMLLRRHARAVQVPRALAPVAGHQADDCAAACARVAAADGAEEEGDDGGEFEGRAEGAKFAGVF